MPFARDRMVECYFWVLGLYFEPQHSLARKILNQIFAFMITLDDIYDVYGTVEELEIFTDAIERLYLLSESIEQVILLIFHIVDYEIACSGGISVPQISYRNT